MGGGREAAPHGDEPGHWPAHEHRRQPLGERRPFPLARGRRDHGLVASWQSGHRSPGVPSALLGSAAMPIGDWALADMDGLIMKYRLGRMASLEFGVRICLAAGGA